MKTSREQGLTVRKNQSLLDYMAIYSGIEEATKDHIERFGVPFEQQPDQEIKQNHISRLKNSGAIFRNSGKSVISNQRISSACEACQTGSGSYTSFVSLKCHRDCYFCFNKNQDDYQFYLHNQRNAGHELETLLDNGVNLTHLALTGGEPLLHPKEALAFFQLANERAPQIHTRLYTAGDLLNEEILQELQAAGLDEIRFSVKLEDSPQKRKHIIGKIELAKRYIRDVLVEMPVIPGTDEEMKELLLALDAIGVFGINLLEFCFPLGNAQAFKDRGFMLKNPPYDVYYNFWYAGGLAVAESEKLCYELVQFAIDQNLKLGVHYCSLENKFTGQIYQQNHDEKLDPTYSFSSEDYYFKTVKAFGKDRNFVKKQLEKKKQAFIENDEYDFIQFSLEALPILKNRNLEVLISSNVVELDQGERQIREVQLERTTSEAFLHDQEK
ncbi:radical SAM protein [Bacillus sp. REN3]|uniref:radical SAM protein n=1 Tax=Bacillus sp. REN3 TaxID=2802440 RepID=UPI001AEE6B46|nr:radical SAM protein [Bacillus sp. REN3]